MSSIPENKYEIVRKAEPNNIEYINEPFYITPTRDSNDVDDGSIITVGGVRCNKNVNAGGINISSSSSINLNGTIIINGITFPFNKGNDGDILVSGGNNNIILIPLSIFPYLSSSSNSSFDNTVARFNGTTGGIIQTGGSVDIDNTNNLSDFQAITIASVSATTGNITVAGGTTFNTANTSMSSNTITSTGGADLALTSNVGITFSGGINIDVSTIDKTGNNTVRLDSDTIFSGNVSLTGATRNAIINNQCKIDTNGSLIQYIDFGVILIGTGASNNNVRTIKFNHNFPDTNYNIIGSVLSFLGFNDTFSHTICNLKKNECDVVIRRSDNNAGSWGDTTVRFYWIAFE